MFCRRISSLSALLAAVFGLISCAHAPEQTKTVEMAPPAPAHEQFVLIGTNDFHGFLRPTAGDFAGIKVRAGGAEWFAGHMRILERKYGDGLIMLDGGDLFQGTIESNSWNGKSVVDFYNVLPYRAAAIGNHEFDYGPEPKGTADKLGALRARIRESKFKWLTANIFLKDGGRNWREPNLRPSMIFTAKGIKFGVIGLTTESTTSKTKPEYIQSLRFGDLAASALKEAKWLREQGADVVLITMHEGGEHPEEPLYEMLKKLPEGTIDAIVSGHSHSQINEFVLGVPVIQARTRGEYFGRIDLFVDKATRRLDRALTKIHNMHPICGDWFAKADHCSVREARKAVLDKGEAEADYLPLRPVTYEGELVTPDERTQQALAPYIAKVDEARREILARAETDFQRYPTGESQVGQLFTTALHDAFPRAKVVYINGGSIRRMFSEGNLTYGDLYEVSPFENTVVLVTITGKDMRQMLDIGTSGSHTIPAVSGLVFTYEAGPDQRPDTTIIATPRHRLRDVRWADTGKPLQDDDRFTLVTNDYLVEGGDHMHRVFASYKRARFYYTDKTVRDTVAEYLRRQSAKKIRFPVAENPRITMLP